VGAEVVMDFDRWVRQTCYAEIRIKQVLTSKVIRWRRLAVKDVDVLMITHESSSKGNNRLLS
jgi:hypothetical protein